MATDEIRKRKRLSYVCTNCKKKKTKCDKALPCGQCVRAECASTCVFEVSDSSRTMKKSPPPYMMSAKLPLDLDDYLAMKHKQKQNDHQASKTELAMLKEKIRLIEQTLHRDSPEDKLKKESSVPQLNEQRQNKLYDEHYPYNNQQLVKNNTTNFTSRLPLHITNAKRVVPDAMSLSHAYRHPVQLPPLKSNPSTSVSSSSLMDSPDGSSASCVSSCTQKFENIDVHALSGKNPYSNTNDVINFYANHTSVHEKDPLRRINFGPFAWATLMRRDLGLSILWDHISESSDKNAVNNTTVFSSNKWISTYEQDNSNTPDLAFQRRALETDGYDDLLSYERRKQILSQKTRLNQNTLQLGLTFYDGNLDRELQLIDKIKMVLPKKKVLWLLVRRFFKALYPFFPYIDEVHFKTALSIIIGDISFEDEPVTSLRIEKRLDLAQVGMLLIMLRLSYLSVFSNKNGINERNLEGKDASCYEILYILSNPINLETIDVAQLCLDQFQLLRRTNISVFQLALFMRLYHTYAPEDGDGADGGDSQVMTSMLIQMGYSLGFNREPTKFKDACNDKRINHLCRKMWLFLVVSDIYQAHSFGNPLNIDPRSFDTKVPWYEEGSENIIDTGRDKLVTASFFYCSSGTFALREILDKVLDVKNGTNMADLCKLLNTHEIYIIESFGTLEKCLQSGPNEDVSTLNMKAKFYLSLKAFYISLYFHFYHFYEHRNIELCYFYIKKLILIAIGDIMPNYYALLGENPEVFALIVNPTLELVIHRSIEVLLACIIRVNLSIYNAKEIPNHEERYLSDLRYRHNFNGMCRLSSAMTRCAEVAISAISKISNRYYYAWKITKSQTFLLKAVTTTEFYAKNCRAAQDLGLCVLRFNVEQMSELTTICETTLQKLKCRLTDHENDLTPKSSMSEDQYLTQAPPPKRVPAVFELPLSSGVQPNMLRDKEHTPHDFRVDYVDNAEVDNLWMSMMALKQGNGMEPNFGKDFGHGEGKDNELGADALQNDKSVEFDLFGNLGFDRLFQTGP